MAFGIANKSYVSAIQLLDKREINPNSLDIHNEEGLTDILGVAGRYKPSTMSSYHHYVNDPLFVQGVQQGATTGAGTVADPLVITLTAASSGFVRKTDLVRLKSGKVGYVINVARGANDVVTVRPNGGATIASAAGDTLSFFSGAVGEKSTAIENRRYSMTKYVNLIQAFREVNEESDIQSMSAIEVNFDGQARYHVKNLADKYIMHKASVNAALIAGSMSLQGDGLTESTFGSAGASPLTDPIGGGNVQTTRGLDEYTALYGVSDQTDVVDVIDMDDFEQTIALLLAKKAPKSYMGYAGTKVQIKIDNTLNGINNSITSGRLSLDGKEFEFGVKKLTYGGFTFQFANLPILDNPELFGGTDIAKNMYLIPTDKVKVRGGGSEPRLQVRYMKHNISGASNKGNDIWGEFHTGGLAPTGATSDELIWRTNWVTYQGLEALGAQHFAKVKVLA